MSNDELPVWDDDFADEMVGRILLVGMTYIDPAGDRLEQCYGEVVSADPKHGICIRLAGKRDGELFWLPPDFRGLFPAKPGSYTLRSTGEIVENPDYTATWSVYPRKN